MARYIGPVCRLCRREGEKLYLKGERCFTRKCAIEQRNYPPGQHGRELQFRRSRPSDYGLQLREKQKLRRIYGVLERQFRRYFEIALRARGMTGALLLILLERRLDNVVYRLGFASSRAQGRQLVRHGHFEVNGRKVDIPSYQVKPGDIIRVRESSREKDYFKAIAEQLQDHRPPPWLQLNPQDLSGQVLRLPVREEIDTRVQEHLIVEFYSR